MRVCVSVSGPIFDLSSFRKSHSTLKRTIFGTRMHSSRMRTGRLLTVFWSLQPGGVYLVRGVYLVVRGLYLVRGGVPGPGGTWSGGYLVLGGVPGPGGYLVPGGCTWSRGGVPGQVLPSPPVNRMTNRCKNITLAKTLFRPVIIERRQKENKKQLLDRFADIQKK